MARRVSDLDRFVKAIAFAARKHRDQRRKDAQASPYINHPIALANVLVHEGGVNDAIVLCAAVLHDTIEDTETSVAELEAEFGKRIASVVLEVTDDKRLPKHERKQRQVDHAPHLSRKAKLVKLADKIANLRDMFEAPPARWSHRRKHQYFQWASRVIEGLRGTHPELERIFDGLVARVGELHMETVHRRK